MFFGADDKKLAIPEYRYLSSHETVQFLNRGDSILQELKQKAPIASGFPSCRFKRARMKKNEFLVVMEEKYYRPYAKQLSS